MLHSWDGPVHIQLRKGLCPEEYPLYSSSMWRNAEHPDFLLLAADRLQGSARSAGSHSSTCDKSEKHQPEGDR